VNGWLDGEVTANRRGKNVSRGEMKIGETERRLIAALLFENGIWQEY